MRTGSDHVRDLARAGGKDAGGPMVSLPGLPALPAAQLYRSLEYAGELLVRKMSGLLSANGCRIVTMTLNTKSGKRRHPTEPRVPAQWPLLAGRRVSVWRTAGSPACVRLEGLLILRPVVRIVAAHLPLHLLQHVGGWPPDVCATRTAFVADRPPRHSDISVPRLQGQRAAGAIGAEGMGDKALE